MALWRCPATLFNEYHTSLGAEGNIFLDEQAVQYYSATAPRARLL
jgi:hypothetical protein